MALQKAFNAYYSMGLKVTSNLSATASHKKAKSGAKSVLSVAFV